MKPANPLPPLTELRQKFLVTGGYLFWRKSGKRAGATSGNGYRQVRLAGRVYLVHRVVFAMTRGYDPKLQIDHINGVKADNRPENLREATDAENKCNRGKYANNVSGFRGVTWHAHNKKWCARVRAQNKVHLVGYFDTPEAASEAYTRAAKALHQSFFYEEKALG